MDTIKLSILIPSVHSRRGSFLPKSMDAVFGQWERLEDRDKNSVEILYLIDNQQTMLGTKRNELIDLAKGEYVVFIDDDDRIEEDYIIQLLRSINANPGVDVINFKVSVTLDGGPVKICTYNKDYDKDFNTQDGYFRLPNHISCVRKEVSKKVSFPKIAYAEDAAYSKILKPHLKTQVQIDKVLYHYDFNRNTTVTQMHLKTENVRESRRNNITADIVILSKTTDSAKRRMTQECIDSMIRGANDLQVRVIVVEQERGITYDNAVTYYRGDTPFNYNAFMNFGATKGAAPWIIFCNNDLVASDAWLHHLLAANWPLVSPKCPLDSRQKDVLENEGGWQTGRNLSGWCFGITRDLYDKMGGLDEDVTFWFSDNCVVEQAKLQNIVPMLVPKSEVLHLGSTTLSEQSREVRDELCWGQAIIFNKKYNQNLFFDNPNFQEYLRIKGHG